MIKKINYLLRYRLAVASVAIAGLVAMGAACSKNQGGGNTPMPLRVPPNFPSPEYDLSYNPITKEGFELGRKLFYDPLLSRDGTISCGTCHIQTSAFTHHGHDVSHGIDDRLGVRNSPAVMNLAWSKSFFWDGGIFHLDLQPIAPIENPDEMGEKLPNVMAKLNASSAYREKFKMVFGTESVQSADVFRALSQFMLHCISADSKYDKVVRKEGSSFTPGEEKGLAIFRSKCASCHSGDLFTDNSFHNNGLAPSILNDSGRFRITLNPADFYLFKTPSLRNIVKTGPYMHDGRFYTLDAVLEHYSSGVADSPTLDPLLKKTAKPGISLSTEEKNYLKAFLNTLTDETFLRDPKLSEQ